MCLIVALMDPRFQPFHFIDSFRTLCPLKDIETCADVADKHVMDGFCLFLRASGGSRESAQTGFLCWR